MRKKVLVVFFVALVLLATTLVSAAKAAGSSCWSATYQKWVTDGNSVTVRGTKYVCRDGRWVKQESGGTAAAVSPPKSIDLDLQILGIPYGGRWGVSCNWTKENGARGWRYSPGFTNGDSLSVRGVRAGTGVVCSAEASLNPLKPQLIMYDGAVTPGVGGYTVVYMKRRW